jgi:hypothetical protein
MANLSPSNAARPRLAGLPGCHRSAPQPRHSTTLPWPDHDGSSARANLRRALSPLKRNLGNQALVIDQDQVGLNPRTELGLDVDAFRTRVAVGLGHGRSSPELCADCGAALAEAAEIYSGDLMAGLQPTG